MLFRSEDRRVRRADTGPMAIGGGDFGDDATPYGPGEGEVDDELLWESFEEWDRDRRDG